MHVVRMFSLCCLSLLVFATTSPVAAQAVLSAEPPSGLATPEGRLSIGRGKDYEPSSVDAETLFDDLRGSMQRRREFAWGVFEKMLEPVELTLLDEVTKVEVPLWQTWYEGRPAASTANRELERIFALYFENLKDALEQDPDADIDAIVAATIGEFSTKDLSATLTDANLSSVLHQLEGTEAAAGELLGRGATFFSPSFIEHAMRQARGIDECDLGAIKAQDDPPSPTQFSPCMEEFPRSAVMIKTSWRELAAGIPDHDTSAAAMTKVMHEGTWPGKNSTAEPPPIAMPTRNEIYTNITEEGTEWALVGVHFVTKDVREWVWVSLWWDPDASQDFGADQPASLANYNNGIWQNYQMCVNSAFEERDPAPWSAYAGHPSLAASLRAVFDGVQKQIDDGAAFDRDEYIAFFQGSTPDPLLMPDALGPWGPPDGVQTSWCSNPNLETHPGNARTSCIGCHQIASTVNERRGGMAQFFHAITGDVPQFGRVRARKNFPAEFSWSFGFEYRPTIAIAKDAAGFEWPQ